MKEHYLIIRNSNSWINKITKKSLLIESLETIVGFFLIFTPVFLILYGQAQIKDLLIGMLMLFFQLGIIILKHKAKNGFRFLIYNSLLIVSIFFVFPRLSEKIIYALIQFITVIYYGKKLKAKPTYYMTFASLAATTLLYMLYYGLSTMTSLHKAGALVTIAAIINITTILVYLQIINKNAVLAWEDNDSAKISEGMSKTSGSVIFLVIFTTLLLNGILWLSGAFAAADGLLSNMKLPSINYNPDYSQKQVVKHKEVEEVDIANKMDKLLEGQHKDSKVLLFIGYIFKAVIIIIITVVLTYVLYALVIEGKEGLKRLLGYKNTKEKRESVLKDSEAANIIPNTINKVKQAVKESLDTSNNMKVRRIYKKLVKRYKASGVMPQKHHTAKIISKTIEEVSSKDYAQLTQVYHKARYSALQCGEEEVKCAKENI